MKGLLVPPENQSHADRCNSLVVEQDDMGSETGYERMVLSQVSTTSAAGGGGRSKRKCSLAINPIYQSGKRLRVEGEHGQ